MSRNDEIRKLGDIKEEEVMQVLITKLKENNIDGFCKRNKYIGDNKYEEAFSRHVYDCDILMTISIANSYRYDEWHKIRWFGGTFNRMFEVKYDRKVMETGNLAIETFSDNKSNGEYQPTGIMKSVSDYWIFIAPDNRYWVIDLQTLRKICFSDDYRVKLKDAVHDDDTCVTTLLHTVTTGLIEENCMDFGIEISKNLNLEKILLSNEKTWYKL